MQRILLMMAGRTWAECERAVAEAREMARQPELLSTGLVLREEPSRRSVQLMLPLRRLRNCPPYCDLIQIGFVGFPEQHVEHTARRFAQLLWQQLQQAGLGSQVTDLLGPAPAAILKINNQFRFRLTLCCANSKPLRLELSQLVKSFSKEKETRGVNLYVDVNGYE